MKAAFYHSTIGNEKIRKLIGTETKIKKKSELNLVGVEFDDANKGVFCENTVWGTNAFITQLLSDESVLTTVVHNS